MPLPICIASVREKKAKAKRNCSRIGQGYSVFPESENASTNPTYTKKTIKNINILTENKIAHYKLAEISFFQLSLKPSIGH